MLTISVSATDAVGATASTTVTATQSTVSTWPDAKNTGVPPGTSLTVMNGNQVITTPNLVLAGKDIRGTVDVRAAGVKIEKCKITVQNSWDWFAILTNGDTIIQDCTISGGNFGVNIINGGGAFRRNNIFGGENAIDPDDGSIIEDNYIHNMQAPGSPHYDGVECGGWSNQNNITIRHNTIDLRPHDQTGTVNLTNDFGSISNVLIENNMLLGGSYSIYTDNSHGGGPITNITIRNNVIDAYAFGPFYFKTVNPTHSGNKNLSGEPLD